MAHQFESGVPLPEPSGVGCWAQFGFGAACLGAGGPPSRVPSSRATMEFLVETGALLRVLYLLAPACLLAGCSADGGRRNADVGRHGDGGLDGASVEIAGEILETSEGLDPEGTVTASVFNVLDSASGVIDVEFTDEEGMATRVLGHLCVNGQSLHTVEL